MRTSSARMLWAVIFSHMLCRPADSVAEMASGAKASIAPASFAWRAMLRFWAAKRAVVVRSSR